MSTEISSATHVYMQSVGSLLITVVLSPLNSKILRKDLIHVSKIKRVLNFSGSHQLLTLQLTCIILVMFCQ